MRSRTLALAALLSLMTVQPAAGQRAGDDTAPGASCAGFVTGATRISPDPTGNSASAILVCNGTTWEAAGFQVGNDSAACTAAKDGTIRYTGGDPPWEYCDGGTTSWVPFRQPRCQDDGTGECYLDATRANDDPEFTASNIADGVNILGVTGTLQQRNICAVDTGPITQYFDEGCCGFFGHPWHDGSYYYFSRTGGGNKGNNGIYAYTFNGSSWGKPANNHWNSNVNDVIYLWGDGTTLFGAEGLSGLRALRYDGANWSLLDTYDSPGSAQEIYSDGTYIYLADGSGGVHALDWDGSNFTLLDTYTTTADIDYITGDGEYIYVTVGDADIEALEFNGTNFNSIVSHRPALGGSWIRAIKAGGGYVYIYKSAQFNNGQIGMLSFNGADFTLEDSLVHRKDQWPSPDIQYESASGRAYFGSQTGLRVYDVSAGQLDLVGAIAGSWSNFEIIENHIISRGSATEPFAHPICDSVL